MEFINVQTELTTAATDAALGLLALISAGYLLRYRKRNVWKILIWCWIMLFLALGSILGVLVHGFKLPTTVQDLLWLPLYLSLGLAVGLFVVSATYDGWGLTVSRRVLPFVVAAGCVFSIVAQLIAGDFIIFFLYEGLGMLFALGVYIWLVIYKHQSGAFQITCGILLTIIAAITQTMHGIVFTVIWQFNNNGLFHFIQIIGIVFLVVGVRRAVLSSDNMKFSTVQPDQ